MAIEASAGAFSLHADACLLDEYDRVLLQHPDQAGTDAQCAAFQERFEGFLASVLEEVQSKSYPLHLDQRAGTLPPHHRSHQAVPSRPPEETEAAEGAEGQ